MNIEFTPNGWDDYLSWKDDKKTTKKINDLIKDITRNGPNQGIGKPEPLLGNLKGFYLRRINDKDRLVYKVKDNILSIISCRFHYGDH